MGGKLPNFSAECTSALKSAAALKYERIKTETESSAPYRRRSFCGGKENAEKCFVFLSVFFLIPFIHTVRNLHFLSENSTLISQEKLSNCFG